MRLGLLLVGHVAATSTDIAGDYPELFAALLGPDVELVRYDLDEDRFPGSGRECDGWLLSPSRCSVYDAHPWITSAEDLLRELLVTERPYVGICFGHQLAAQALGAPVQRASDGWQVGVRDYEIVAPQSWMRPRRSSVALVASHEDQVLAVPDGAELLARSRRLPDRRAHDRRSGVDAPAAPRVRPRAGRRPAAPPGRADRSGQGRRGARAPCAGRSTVRSWAGGSARSSPNAPAEPAPRPPPGGARPCGRWSVARPSR